MAKFPVYKASQQVTHAEIMGEISNLRRTVRWADIKPGDDVGALEILTDEAPRLVAAEVPLDQVPAGTGRVVFVFQRKSDGIGHIEVRWNGSPLDIGSTVATYIFADESGQSLTCHRTPPTSGEWLSRRANATPE
jgi:hypothetical protein